MRTYETLYIVRPELNDDEVNMVVRQVEAIVKDNGGSVVQAEIWGKRRLAYEVQHCTEGNYVLLRFEAPAPVIPKLESHFRITEPIIRHVVVHFDEQMLRREAEQIRRKEEQAKASMLKEGLPPERREAVRVPDSDDATNDDPEDDVEDED